LIDPKRYRSAQLSKLTNTIGVYALCDLDGVPVYVGQSVDGIRQRVQRHLTSARSDIIANRMIDVWEIAFVRAWPVAAASQIGELEQVVSLPIQDSLSTLSVIPSA
jgi:Uri superfamily endonuclease